MKVDRQRAIHSLRLTASQGTSNIPFHWFLLLGCNRQAQKLKDSCGIRNGKTTTPKKRRNQIWHKKLKEKLRNVKEKRREM